MNTNSNNTAAVQALLQVTNLMESPRFASFTTRLVGEEKKGVRRGDHVMQYVVVLGADYRTLVQRSMDTLQATVNDPVQVQKLLEDFVKDGIVDEQTGQPVSLQDLHDAVTGTVRGRKGLLTAYSETLAGSNQDYTLEGYMSPLTVDGQTVAGVNVYTGPEHTDDPRSPQPGSMYLKCVVVASKLITPSPNGDKIPSKRGAVARIKDYLESKLDLPVRRFRTFRLQPGDAATLKIGKSVMEVAEDGSVTVS